ncbi:DUF3953 domain-containing protein [Bacillus salacetis]|uniref:DUF3953 domain-containing protein n=1 Tax=Bacillus salacetis TaxID=2315464 RepID=UPI003BA18587
MKTLEKTRYILAVIGICLGFINFFIDNIQIPYFIILLVLLLMVSLMGVEEFKNKKVKSGYFYIVAAIIISLAVIKDLFIYM